ncbi:GD15067 [Drosophila simulans]|uniref:GD15067 n=1 Tax=Drosophila simulans TaxID=7240 RepID=B4QLW0_DROSI|nr:GD15067 [Drosophila simulans]
MVHGAVAGNPDAKRLYDDLLSNYNKLVRPVVNTTDVLKVCIKLKLSQLIDVNLKNQIMTTNLWVEQGIMEISLLLRHSCCNALPPWYRWLLDVDAESVRSGLGCYGARVYRPGY